MAGIGWNLLRSFYAKWLKQTFINSHMPKIQIIIAGVTSNYEIDQEQSDQPQIECSNHEETLSLSFSAEQYRIYYNGGVAVAHDEEGREIMCRSFSRK